MRTEGGGHDQPGIRAAVLAIIPAHDEGAQVASVVAGTRAHLPVLVVDDGSTDETALRAEAAGATVLRQVPNQGKGAALRAGFQRALHEGFEAVLTLDADGQHDPSEIPKFLDAYSAHQSDLIVGARDFAHMPWVRPHDQLSRSETLLLGRRSTYLGQPIGLSAGQPAPARGDAPERRIWFRIRGGDDRAVRPARLPFGLDSDPYDLHWREKSYPSLASYLSLSAGRAGGEADEPERPQDIKDRH